MKHPTRHGNWARVDGQLVDLDQQPAPKPAPNPPPAEADATDQVAEAPRRKTIKTKE